MKVLVIGAGGREHALCWKLADSPLVTSLFCAPGNPGTAQFADNIEIPVTDFDGIETFARAKNIDLVVIGPEDPLAAGLADRLRAVNILVFGPNREAAQLEGDKWFAKELMRQQSIPTAESRSFTDPVAAEEWLKVRDEPVVIKATGLAKGKGVTVCYRTSDALEAIDRIMRKREFGAAGARVLIEEKLTGPECSILAFVAGKTIYPLEPAQDHKTIDEGDTGPMTGGMGAYSPTPIVTPKLMTEIEQSIFIPVIDGLVRDNIDYQGVLYAGLMLTPAGPRVLEFNCRFGDPETQPLMMRLKGDLAEIMTAVANNTLFKLKTFKWDPRPALTVVATSKGYPGKYTTGVPITGVDKADALKDVKVFHSGTAMKDGQLVTAGGRVLSVTAIGNTLQDAHARAYEAMSLIHFDGMHFRRDIGYQALH
ncbi:MAG TPA: phosphoribosylamine--glycine ligase [Tepidisphaeraceae bacterium]|jgi:phosphoribosylamine--glycine ligase|nr:phosphoribosylamine--glycine ligase [Tepidisphaeraceae bacterium]